MSGAKTVTCPACRQTYLAPERGGWRMRGLVTPGEHVCDPKDWAAAHGKLLQDQLALLREIAGLLKELIERA